MCVCCFVIVKFHFGGKFLKVGLLAQSRSICSFVGVANSPSMGLNHFVFLSWTDDRAGFLTVLQTVYVIKLLIFCKYDSQEMYHNTVLISIPLITKSSRAPFNIFYMPCGLFINFAHFPLGF